VLGGAALVVAVSLARGRFASPPIQEAEAPMYGYRVVNAYPHDPEAFTQGLVYRNGFLYESTGLNTKSSLRKVQLETGKVIQRRQVHDQYFAEGLADWGGKLIQLTWRSNVAFVYDQATFNLERTFPYVGEGWGLMHDDKRLIMSDGSASLRFLDPTTFAETGRLTVTDRGQPVENLNELEMVRGEIYANIWQTDRIARVAPASGRVTGWIDLSGLLPVADQEAHHVDVLNGIAYDAEHDRLFVTGKLWPKLFEIALVRR
jgi:glutaminyl-peptide cyclotransferase